MQNDPLNRGGYTPERRPAFTVDDDGRIARGFRALSTSWDLLKRRPVLFVLPAISAISVTLAAYAIFVPVLYLDHDLLPSKLAVAVAVTATALPFTFATTFFNVGFIAMVHAHWSGDEPSIRYGLRVAWSRLGTILKWSLLATAVGGLLRSLEEIPGVGGLAGRVAELIGGVAWSLATYFVIPVFVLEDTGVREGIRRSARVFRSRWGETLTGGLAIGVAFGMLLIPAAVLLCSGVIALDESVATGLVLIALAVLLGAPLLALSSALTEMFQLVLYREATEGAPPPGFDRAVLDEAFVERRRWFRRNSDHD